MVIFESAVEYSCLKGKHCNMVQPQPREWKLSWVHSVSFKFKLLDFPGLNPKWNQIESLEMSRKLQGEKVIGKGTKKGKARAANTGASTGMEGYSIGNARL